MPQPSQPISFRIRPALQLRFAAGVIICAGLPAALLVAVAAGLITGNSALLTPTVAVTLGCMLLFGGLACGVPLWWKWQLSDKCVSQRRLGGWSHWPWTGVAGGQVQKVHPYTLIDRSQPRRRQRMTFSWLSPADISTIYDAINAHYQLPPAEDLAGAVSFQFGQQQTAVLDENGVCIKSRDGSMMFLWDEVQSAAITRVEPLCRQFTRLKMQLPGASIDWSPLRRTDVDASASVAAILETQLPPEVIQVEISG